MAGRWRERGEGVVESLWSGFGIVFAVGFGPTVQFPQTSFQTTGPQFTRATKRDCQHYPRAVSKEEAWFVVRYRGIINRIGVGVG